MYGASYCEGGDEMLEVIMIIAAMFFFVGFFFEKAMKIAANEWREARKEYNND